jgi:hypothetical protein
MRAAVVKSWAGSEVGSGVGSEVGSGVEGVSLVALDRGVDQVLIRFSKVRPKMGTVLVFG